MRAPIILVGSQLCVQIATGGFITVWTVVTGAERCAPRVLENSPSHTRRHTIESIPPTPRIASAAHGITLACMVPNEFDCVATLPFLTGDLPGVGGHSKDRAEDFLVEELPLYEPSGEGTHTYFVIEKRGMTTMAAVKAVARALGRQARDIGYAGLKDARAVTRQTLSVEHIDPERVGNLYIMGLEILSVAQHRNKLKRGHLRGNRFVLNIRETEPNPRPRAEAIMNVLADRGLPNTTAQSP